MKKLIFAAAIAAFAPACASTPKTAGEQQSLETKAAGTLAAMRQQDPTIDPVLSNAYGYAVFPSVSQAGFIAGGASGSGILYVRGQPVGNLTLTQASVGAQAGAQTFSELVVLHNEQEVNQLKAGSLDLGASASAVLLKAGAGASTPLARGPSVFLMPQGGAMVNLSLAGQQIKFEPFAG